MMKKTFALSIFLSLSGVVFGQITLIPDAAFELTLIDQGIDTDGMINGQVWTSDIADETDLSLFDYGITDLTGLEDFASLEDLDVTQMEITEINLSQNTNLTHLSISMVNLESLDITQNVNLINLFLGFKCENCPFESTVSSLDLSQNTELISFYLGSDFITEIDVSNNPNIGLFQLQRLDALVDVNLKNNNNSNIGFLRIRECPNLICVQVDDPAAVIAGVDPPYDDWIIENDPLISEDCYLGVEDVVLRNISIYPNPVTDMLTVDSNSSLTITSLQLYDVLGKLVLQKETDFERVDVSILPAGLFMMIVETNVGLFTEKIIKK